MSTATTIAASAPLPRRVHKGTFALFVVFGVGAWVTINGVFAELSLLVDALPESWSISSYVSVAIQAANVGPLLFFLASRCTTHPALLHIAVAAIVAACTLACSLMAFFWDHTSRVGGSVHATTFIGLCFLSALADCTSSVVFYPFVSQYRTPYMSALNAGASLSGFIASALSWIQTGFFTREDNPVFSPKVYFLLLALTMVLSGIAYIALCRLPACLAEREKDYCGAPGPSSPSSFQKGAGCICQDAIAQEKVLLIGTANAAHESEHGGGGSSLHEESHTDCTPLAGHTDLQSVARKSGLDLALPREWLRESLSSLALLVWLSFLQNGIPSVLSYACMPYSTRTYHVAQTLSLCVAPFGALLTLSPAFVPSQRTLGVLCVAWTLPFMYILAVAVRSPTPPMMHEAGGPALVILASLVSSLLVAHSKAVITMDVKARAQAQGRFSLQAVMFWTGASVQLGSLVGALLFFCLIQYTRIFQE